MILIKDSLVDTVYNNSITNESVDFFTVYSLKGSNFTRLIPIKLISKNGLCVKRKLFVICYRYMWWHTYYNKAFGEQKIKTSNKIILYKVGWNIILQATKSREWSLWCTACKDSLVDTAYNNSIMNESVDFLTVYSLKGSNFTRLIPIKLISKNGLCVKRKLFVICYRYMWWHTYYNKAFGEQKIKTSNKIILYKVGWNIILQATKSREWSLWCSSPFSILYFPVINSVCSPKFHNSLCKI